MSHNAEAEACDALMEIEQLDELGQYVDESAFPESLPVPHKVCFNLYFRVSVFEKDMLVTIF